MKTQINEILKKHLFSFRGTLYEKTFRSNTTMIVAVSETTLSVHLGTEMLQSIPLKNVNTNQLDKFLLHMEKSLSHYSAMV